MTSNSVCVKDCGPAEPLTQTFTDTFHKPAKAVAEKPALRTSPADDE